MSVLSPSSACHFPVTSDAGNETIRVPIPPVNFLKTPATPGATVLLGNNANMAGQQHADVCFALTHQYHPVAATTKMLRAAVCSPSTKGSSTIHYIAYHYYGLVLFHIYTWGLTNYIATVVSHPSSHLMFTAYWSGPQPMIHVFHRGSSSWGARGLQ